MVNYIYNYLFYLFFFSYFNYVNAFPMRKLLGYNEYFRFDQNDVLGDVVQTVDDIVPETNLTNLVVQFKNSSITEIIATTGIPRTNFDIINTEPTIRILLIIKILIILLMIYENSIIKLIRRL